MAKPKLRGVVGKGYDTMEDAAAAALEFIRGQPDPDKQEYAAGIWQDSDTGKYYRTQLATSRRKGHVGGKEIGKVLNAVPDVTGLRGMVHNHPDQRFAEFFSEADLQNIAGLTEQIRVAKPGAKFGSFIEAMEKGGAIGGEQRRLNPDSPGRTKRVSVPRKGTMTGIEGERFLAQYPMDEMTQRLARKILGRDPSDARGLKRSFYNLRDTEED